MKDVHESQYAMITSRDNAAVKDVVRLHTARYRREVKRFIAEGERCCSTLIAAGVLLQRLYVREAQIEQAIAFADESLIVLVTEPVMTKMSTASTPSGMMGVFQIPQQQEAVTGPGLVLAALSDPGNAGTLIRSAVAFGSQSVVCIESVDPWSPKVVQASVGTIGSISVITCSWDELLARKGDLQLCALKMADSTEKLSVDADQMLLVVGSEAHGIPAAMLATCEHQFSIPMAQACESLNAAVAGSLALYINLSS